MAGFTRRRPETSPRKLPTTAPTIIVHSLAHALMAVESAAASEVPVTLRSAAGAAGNAGVGWFAALAAAVRIEYPAATVTFVLDCADEPGTALAALRHGVTHIRFTGSEEAAAKLIAIGLMLDRDDRPPLDLLNARDAKAACRNWLAEAGVAS